MIALTLGLGGCDGGVLVATGSSFLSSEGSDGASFLGVRSVAWDGADGLVVGFDTAEGSPDAYHLSVLDDAGNVVRVSRVDPVAAVGPTATDTTGTGSLRITTPVTGLGDGVYQIQVTASWRAFTLGGDHAITQLVGANRLHLAPTYPVASGLGRLTSNGIVVAVAGGASGAAHYVVRGLFEPDFAGFGLETRLGPSPVDAIDLEGDAVVLASAAPNDGAGLHVGSLASDDAILPLTSEVDSALGVVARWPMLYAADAVGGRVVAVDAATWTATTVVGSWSPPSGILRGLVRDGDSFAVAYGEGAAVFDADGAPSVEPRATLVADGASVDVAAPVGTDLLVTATSTAGGGFDIRQTDAPTTPLASIPAPSATVTPSTAHGVQPYVVLAWAGYGFSLHDLTAPGSPVALGSAELPGLTDAIVVDVVAPSDVVGVWVVATDGSVLYPYQLFPMEVTWP